MNNIEAPQSFYDQHRESLSRLFEIVGVPTEAAESLKAATAATQPWVRGDHIKPEQRFEIDTDDEPELRNLYGQFGLRQEHELPGLHYDQILVLGGTYWGSKHRLGFLNKAIKAGGISTDEIVLLGGEREVFPEEVPVVEDDLNQIDLLQLWMLRASAGGQNIHWETDMLRLASLLKLGAMVRLDTVEVVDETDLSRPHIQNFSWRDIPVALMHTKAVERNGAARHTTEACMTDWIKTAAPESDAVVGFVAANPHTTRVGRSANAMLKRHDREDISLVPAGPSVLPGVGHHTYLGEIARHLYEDTRN